MRALLITLATILVIGMSGCGYKEGVKSEAARSYLYFTGFSKEANNISVSIDKGERFSVISGEQNHYAIKPGKHRVEVYRDDALVVEREIYLGDGIAKEIEVH